MAIVPQAIPISFAKGLDLKTDPLQIEAGNFISLVNASFTTGKRLTKRNGYGPLATLPSPTSFATTFNGDLTAIGSTVKTPFNGAFTASASTIQAYSAPTSSWVNKGNIQPLELSTLPLVRNNLNQIQSDTAIAPNGLICTTYTETDGSTLAFKYSIADSVTGQNIVAPTAISGADSVLGTPKVFVLGSYFIIVYTVTVSSANHLVFIAVSTSNPNNVTAQANISTNYKAVATLSFDGVVFSNNLYLAWNGASSSGIKMAFISSNLVVSSTFTVDASHSATIMSVCVDMQTSTIWASYFDAISTNGYSVAVNTGLSVLSGYPVNIITGTLTDNLASAAQNGVMTVFQEIDNTASGIPTNFIVGSAITQSSAAISSVISIRSVGLASKAFIVNENVYYLGIYSSQFQPTYFLINGSLSTSVAPVIVAKLAYENGGSYLVTGLPSVSVSGESAALSYFYKDLIAPLEDSNDDGTMVVGGTYSQTGINLANFTFSSANVTSAEIGSNLNIVGGYLIAYDGYLPVEQGFHLWPDSVQNTSGSTTGGFMTAQLYYYQVTYEWSDNQGNQFRSAGSIPQLVDLSGGMTSTNQVTLTIPTLRLTAKTINPVKIVVYRWSTGQQEFIETGNGGNNPITHPLLNDTTVDTVTFVDKSADTAAEDSSHFIDGNAILYTTGGVIEDIGPPSFVSTFLFDDRLWGITSEDQNLLWYSKQVIEATPVEMSDLLTLYIAPTIGAQGATGFLKAGAAMDDKLILFKQSGIYYINGTGPDNTGANSQYSQPTFITSMVGCSNQRSIVFQPGGLMFEFASDAGNQIWILGRDLSTIYIGAPVQQATQNATVLSAISVPGTNEVRFNMSSGITLKYDYFYEQWGIHTTNAISSTLYQGLHTYIAPNGSVFQETPGLYLDGSTPVLLSFVTGWIQLSGISGYQRLWEIQLLGEYASPHLLNTQIGYNFAPLSEQALIQPDNFTGNYGSDSLYGQTTPYGGPGQLEQWRIQPATQKCQSFQLSLSEVYDPSFGVTAGEGFTLSSFTCVIGVQRGYRPVKAANTVGTS